MNLQTKVIGNGSMILYGLVMAISSILIHSTAQNTSPILLAFNNFIFCLLVYSLFSLQTFKKYGVIQQHLWTILMLNITTAICWITTFVSLKYIPPELFLFTYLCAMPISAAIMFGTKMIKSFMLLLGLIGLIYSYHTPDLWFGILLAFLGGTSGTVYSIYAKRITAIFTSSEILSLRFYLTVLLTFCLCIILGEWRFLSLTEYFEFSILSLISVLIPLTLFQVGLKNLSLMKALSYMPLAPLLCYGMNLTFGNLAFNMLQFGAVVLLSLAMII